MYLIYVVLVLCFQQLTIGQTENVDSCKLLGDENGKCVIIDKCPYAQNLLKKKIFPKICGFEGKSPVVCCQEEKRQQIYMKPGQLSSEKCNEYYPKPDEQDVEVLVPGGKPSAVREFPHMAVIGFGDKDNIQWQCGGSLISRNFVLTAAHCLFSRELGPAKFVRLGDLDITTDADQTEPQNFTIKRRIPHPEYKNPSRYNDIGLVELDKQITRTGYVNMACLDTTRHHDEKSMTAIGWGKTEFIGDFSNLLLKADLDLVEYHTCNKSYAGMPGKELLRGIVDDMHICAGGKPEQDTCQGDSGGPLQIRVQNRRGWYNYYNIVGITSFGKACGISRTPGVYTRVYNYLQWIESIVWPS
ncbi:venom protease-like [Anoplophora glabripennis]|uniref:venom protease-like n=1 Tax=Anoplophora glabripennis TaxID=217634 RepID=UPI000C778D1F|nr:venom protease-like [Anoplophora glabripennis]